MDLLVALALATELVLTGGLIATVPAASQFNSVPRTCDPYLTGLAVVYFFVVRDALRAERVQSRLDPPGDEEGGKGAAGKNVVAEVVKSPSLFPWVTDPGDAFATSHKVRFAVAFLFYLYALTLLKLFADESSKSSWPWYARPPCGSSSCSAQTSADVVYNAAGFFVFGMWQDNDFAPTLGVYDSCEWASSNGLPPLSYPPLVNNTGYPNVSAPACSPVQAPTCVLTTRPQDWRDPGFGSVHGVFPGFATPPTRQGPCPGVSYDPVKGYVGLSCCSYCMAYWKRVYHFAASHPDIAYCPAATGSNANGEFVWCAWLIPRPYELRTPDSQQQQLKYGVLYATSLLLFSYVLKLLQAWSAASLSRDRRRGWQVVPRLDPDSSDEEDDEDESDEEKGEVEGSDESESDEETLEGGEEGGFREEQV